jgi:hypothetical protein
VAEGEGAGAELPVEAVAGVGHRWILEGVRVGWEC